MAIVISTIAMMALAAPFVAERRFWLLGTAQSESQRDAQVGLRAIARRARQGSSYAIGMSGAQIGFTTPTGSVCYQGGPVFGNQLRLFTTLNCTGAYTALIDGNRSQVTTFTTASISSRIVQVQLAVQYNNSESESLITEIYLRNAT